MTPIQQAAIDYVEAGLHVLALTQKKPNPRVHGESWSWEDSYWTDTELTDADRSAIEQAFDESKGTTGIAILIPPDFFVADVDTERAGTLLQELGWQPTPNSIVAQTKNGLHIWFWMPGADRNRWLGDGQQPDPGRTLLFKGLGGYVVAPPSAHFDAHGVLDGTYSWLPDSALVANGQRYMPDVLPAEARVRMERADLWAADKADSIDPVATFTLTPVEGLPWWQWPKTWHYLTEGLEKAIENAADGNQNNVIHWAACVARDEGVPLEVAMTRLMAAAKRGNHPEGRARDTIRGAYKRAPRG